MKTITTYYNTDFYALTIDNNTTHERIETSFVVPVTLKEAVRKAKKYMELLDNGTDEVYAIVTSAITGEVLAEIEKRA